MVSANCRSRYFIMSDTCLSSFNWWFSAKSSPGVSIRDRRIRSIRDSHISTHAVLIVSVRELLFCRKVSTEARCSADAVGEMSAVSMKSRNKDVYRLQISIHS